MNIIVNGNRTILSERLSLREFIEQNHLNQDAIVIEINRTIIQKKDYTSVSLKENDVVEIVSFVGGGR